MDDRAEFEQWATKERSLLPGSFRLERTTDEKYYDLEMQAAWRSWQAAKARPRERDAQIADNPYGDEVEVIGREEPSAVGHKIAEAIRRQP